MADHAAVANHFESLHRTATELETLFNVTSQYKRERERETRVKTTRSKYNDKSELRSVILIIIRTQARAFMPTIHTQRGGRTNMHI